MNPWCLTAPSSVPPTSQYWFIPFCRQISAKSHSIWFKADCRSLRSPSALGKLRKNLFRVSKSVSPGSRYCAQKRMSSLDLSAIWARWTSWTTLQDSSPIPCIQSRISNKTDSCAFKLSRNWAFSCSKESIRPINFCIDRSDGQNSLSRSRLARDVIIPFLFYDGNQ